jgi:hypothetical protein
MYNAIHFVCTRIDSHKNVAWRLSLVATARYLSPSSQVCQRQSGRLSHFCWLRVLSRLCLDGDILSSTTSLRRKWSLPRMFCPNYWKSDCILSLYGHHHDAGETTLKSCPLSVDVQEFTDVYNRNIACITSCSRGSLVSIVDVESSRDDRTFVSFVCVPYQALLNKH